MPKSKKPRTISIKVPADIAPVVAGAVSFALEVAAGWPAALARAERDAPGRLSLQLAGFVDDLRRQVREAEEK